MTTPRTTEYLALSELKADPRNPKAHDLEVIDASVGRFGIIDNIARDDRTGYIISGHGRTKTLQAMRERGESAPDGVVVREDGEWLVPVITGWRSRTDAEAGAALIALNRTTELGGWVDEALLDILDDLAQGDGAGLDGVGFSEEEIDDLRAVLEEAGFSEDEVDIPSDSHDPKSVGKEALEGLAEGFDLHSRRSVVMDFSVAEYREVIPRLAALRDSLAQPDNASAVRAVLADMFPDVEPIAGD